MSKIAVLFFIVLNSALAQEIVVIGDAGKNNAGQQTVSDALLKVCTQAKCTLGVMAGDNVYPRGVLSATDPVLLTMFDKYYNKLNFPFLIALGNHDYGKTLAPNWVQGGYQVQHSLKNKLFHIPKYWYTYETEHAIFAVLDTTRILFRKDTFAQGAMVKEAHAKAVKEKKWLFVVGHHPFLSNGDHGNAGKYSNITFPYFYSGSNIKAFIKAYVCGKAQFYLAGHDHNLQLIDGKVANCQTQFVVSGTAATTTKLTKRNAVKFQAEALGFFKLSVGASKVDLKVIDSTTKVLYEESFTK